MLLALHSHTPYAQQHVMDMLFLCWSQAALQGEQEALQGAGDKLSAFQSSNADLQQQLDHAQSAAQREAGSLQTQIASLQVEVGPVHPMPNATLNFSANRKVSHCYLQS